MNATDSANTALPLETGSSRQTRRLGKRASTQGLFWPCLDNGSAQDYQSPPLPILGTFCI